MNAKQAKAAADEVQAESDISKVMLRIETAAKEGRYLIEEYGLKEGQVKALKELGYNITARFISWQ